MRKLRSDQSGMGVIELLLLLIILIILGLLGWYVWKQNQDAKKPIASSNSQPAVTTKKSTANTEVAKTPACKDPSASASDNIKASITSGNTAALEGYMASKVTVIIAASEGIGEQTPTQAVTDITGFIGDPATTTWDFALSSTTISGYSKSFYKTYFPSNAIVGKSSANKVISFSFNCDGKISTVFEAASDDLLQ